MPTITADWGAKSSQRWTVPLGGAVGNVFRIGNVLQLGVYYNVIRPEGIGPEYQVRVQIGLRLPGF